MSTKVNLLLPAVYLALGIAAPEVVQSPVLETLLNDYKVSGLEVVQVNDSGRCIVMAYVQVAAEPVSLRPVANANGDIKLFADMGAVYPLIKRAKLVGATVSFYRKDKAVSIGDPVAMLKGLYKSFKAEKAVADKNKVFLQGRMLATQALGWDVAVGTAERFEYDDFVQRLESVNEALAYCTSRIAALAASLLAAGVDPVTVV